MSQLEKPNSDSLPILSQVRVKEPCHVNWGGMAGDAKRRFCGQCQKHVHDLSEMDAESALVLLANEKNVCIRYRRNRDGTIVTKNEKVVVSADNLSRRNWLARFTATAAGLLTMLTFGGCDEPIEQGEVLMGKFLPPEAGDPPQFAEMGEAIAPPDIRIGNDHDDETEEIELTSSVWQSLNGEFLFELDSKNSYDLVPFKAAKPEHSFGHFVKFEDGKFKSYNSAMCGNDVFKTVTGTYTHVGKNKIKIFVEHIERNEYCSKKSESPKRSYGVYALSRIENGIRISKT